ncbi:MAG TPA: polymer-forming cytoskeletal protein, partial [Verrucomicrobiales bacterium]|nr:polymer-forming cytoskeletal protein [Verrucomicrobiales bacterium]
RCELKANSQLDGDITTGILKMDEGAVFSGKMQTGK